MIWLLAFVVSAHGEPGAIDVDNPGLPPPPPANRLSNSLGNIPPEIAELARSVADQPLHTRMAAISEAMLGRPYMSDPLGEGTGTDPDPIARYDAFDCLTFAEEVLALSLANDPLHAAKVRSDIRYGVGKPVRYIQRRHFMELQWIPGVVEDGWMRMASSDYGPVTVLEKEVTDETWKWWRPRRSFAHTDDQLPKGTMRLEVLDIKTAQRVADQIRPGSVILTVRKDRPGVPIWVTHVSLLVENAEGKPVMRHATKMGSGGTKDHPLDWYLRHLETYKNWKVEGIAVMEPIEPGPRRSAAP